MMEACSMPCFSRTSSALSSVLTKSKTEVANELVVVFVRSFSSSWMLLELRSEFLKKRLSDSALAKKKQVLGSCQILNHYVWRTVLCANIQVSLIVDDVDALRLEAQGLSS